MDARTLEALKASIQHWEQNASINDLHEADVNWHSCALCMEFNSSTRPDDEENNCSGCPLSEKTGTQYCEKTPFMGAWDAVHLSPDLETFKKHAQAELDFLRSLLPAEQES